MVKSRQRDYKGRVLKHFVKPNKYKNTLYESITNLAVPVSIIHIVTISIPHTQLFSVFVYCPLPP